MLNITLLIQQQMTENSQHAKKLAKMYKVVENKLIENVEKSNLHIKNILIGLTNLRG